MQVSFRSRLMLPFALALAVSAVVTGQARAQVAGYEIKSARTVSYIGDAAQGGVFASYINIPGDIDDNPSLVRQGARVGCTVVAIINAFNPWDENGFGQAQADANVEAIIRITDGTRPQKVFYTMGTYGSEYGTLSAYGKGSILYGMDSQHGTLDDILSSSGGSQWIDSLKNPGLCEGPELTTSTDCYYDDDGDYVFKVALINTVQNQGQYTVDHTYEAHVNGYASIANCSYLKKINGQTWDTGNADMLNTSSSGIGIFPPYHGGPFHPGGPRP